MTSRRLLRRLWSFFVPIALATCLIYTSYLLLSRDVGQGKRRHRAAAINDFLKSEEKTAEDEKWIKNRLTNNLTALGYWLLSEEGSDPPAIQSPNRSEPFLILVWENGPFLERRHLKRFTSNDKFSPWEGCSVNNCKLTYESVDLDEADAVLFHLHRTRAAKTLPKRRRTDQRWIFLSDESPCHTFLYGSQNISDYNGMFNWSMTYRMDSDVPVPYGRTVFSGKEEEDRSIFKRPKDKLVAILGSNCSGRNNRWEYVRMLKSALGAELEILGRCLQGNTTVCPGHFDADCPHLERFKFYLAFENSNCRDYLSEKTFWNAYAKRAVPVIMGAPPTDCERLLPPNSYLHVSDFANAASLADYLLYLDRNEAEYAKLHAWRSKYRVINEHGYFGSASRHYCRVCEALNYNRLDAKVYEDLGKFWNVTRDCF